MTKPKAQRIAELEVQGSPETGLAVQGEIKPEEMPVGILSQMVPLDNETKEAIMISMMETDEHLSLKTELTSPMDTTQLQMFGEWLRMNGLVEAAEAIDKFVVWFKENMVSDHRKGRKELFRTLAAMQEEENVSRWTGEPKEEGAEK
jgi:hypothetical protein